MTTRAARFAAAAVILAGIALTAWIHASVPGPVFWSGDAGLKWLCVRQVLEGGSAARIELGGPDWVRELRDGGLYPFLPPFVYRTDAGDLPQYPLPFLLLTAPFASWFGARGTLVLPALSLFAMWWVHARTLRTLGVGGARAVLSLAALALGSPLLLYGSMFWEHAPAAFVVHLAVCRVVAAHARPAAGADGGSTARAGWSAATGLLFGLSFWLRPECGVAAVAFAGLAFVAPLLPPGARRLPFAAGVVAGAAGFLAWNRLVHGLWFGVHGRNLEPDVHSGTRLANIAANGPLEFSHLLWVFPAAVVPWIAAAARRVRGARDAAPSWTGPLALWTVASIAGAIAITPSTPGKEIGPRFFLHVIPALCLLLPWAVPPARTPATRALAAGAVLAVAAGVAMNSVLAVRGLRADYRGRVWPAMQAVLAHESPVVVAAADTATLEMTGASDRKLFLLARDDAGIARAARAMKDRGIRRFPFVSQDNRPHPRAQSFEVRGEGVVVRFTRTLRTPQFLVYEAAVE